MKRSATAVWHGSGKEGSGHLSTVNKVLDQTKYSWHSRFEHAPGTNPEELLAAAHAGCFSMKLSFVLGHSGVTPEEINTTCEVTLENGAITQSHLTVKVKATGITQEKFDHAIKEAKETCPISKSITANVTAEAVLES